MLVAKINKKVYCQSSSTQRAPDGVPVNIGGVCGVHFGGIQPSAKRKIKLTNER